MPVFELTVQRVFSAAHAIVIQGQREAMHGHDWRVTARVAGPSLDDDGLLCDFHALERDLDEIIRPFQNACLNDTPPFDEINPTAERVAEFIASELARRVHSPVRLLSVSVTEAPGCEATLRLSIDG